MGAYAAIPNPLDKYKESIENDFGEHLVWERLNDKKASRIRFDKNDVNIFNENDWPAMIDFLVDAMIKLESAFKEPIMQVRKKLIETLKSSDI